jgi:hypothetical protein
VAPSDEAVFKARWVRFFKRRLLSSRSSTIHQPSSRRLIAKGSFQSWGKLQKAAINANLALATNILSLSKDVVLGPKRPFQDPSRFTDPAGSTGDRLNVTMLQQAKQNLPPN